MEEKYAYGISHYVNPIGSQRKIHGNIRLSHTSVNGRSRIIYSDSRIRVGRDPQVDNTCFHNIRFYFTEQKPQKPAV